MKEPLYGVFRAIVTETECFRTTGKIKTRISIFNNNYISKDLLDSFDANTFSKTVERDKLTSIMLPFGGGIDCGLFSVPQVNTIGLVTFIDGNTDNPIWIGGTSSNIFSTSGELIKSNYPSDNVYSNESIISLNEDSQKVEFNSEKINSFVIKTKTNELNDLSNPDSMNWEKNEIENGIVLNKNRMELLHVGNEGNIQDILLDNNEEYSIKIKNEKDEKNYSIISIGNKGIKIEKKSNLSECFIYMEEDSNKISFKKDNLETNITQTEKTLKLENDASSISLSKINLKDEVIIQAPKVRISSENIILGNGDFKLVVSPSNFNLTMEDGTLLTTAKNVRI